MFLASSGVNVYKSSNNLAILGLSAVIEKSFKRLSSWIKEAIVISGPSSIAF